MSTQRVVLNWSFSMNIDKYRYIFVQDNGQGVIQLILKTELTQADMYYSGVYYSLAKTHTMCLVRKIIELT